MPTPSFRQLQRLGNVLRVALLALASLAAFPYAFAENDPPIQQHYDISLGELLDENGNIELPESLSGSIDPAGYEMVGNKGEAPRFVRSSAGSGVWSEGEFGVPGCDGSVSALAAVAGELFVGGQFRACGFAAVSNIARFDPGTGEFSSLGDEVNGAVFALAASGDDLYVGGLFAQAGGNPANLIAVFDTSQTGNAGWSPLGDGVNIPVSALAAIGDDLYVGGAFTEAGGTAANRIAVFDTTQTGNSGWSTLGDGANSNVNTLVTIGDKLFVGGQFTQAGSVAANRIAVFDTTQTGNAGWSALGDGVNNRVRALTAIGDELYVGGYFTQAGGTAANRIAVFDTTQTGNVGWSSLGDGVNSFVFALAPIDDDLYVGGGFTEAGGAGAARIAVFDTKKTGNVGWSTLGDGVNSSVFALAEASQALYIGGSFVIAGGNVNGYLARYSANLPPMAKPDSVSTDENTALTGDVLADNGSGTDDDPDGDPLAVTEVNGVAGNVGTQITLASGALLTVNSDGTFSYDPNGQFETLAVGDSAAGTFDYTISDGLASDSATVTITINGANDAPMANADARSTPQNSVLNASDADGTATGADPSDDGVLANDTDIDGDALAVDQVEGDAGNVGTAVTLTSGATVTMAADGTFVYDPNGQFIGLDAGEQGSDAFSYRISDGNATSTSTVCLTIDGVNTPPSAADDVFSTNEDTQRTGNVFADNGNGTDIDPDDPLAVMNAGTLTATGLGGNVSLQTNGDFTYTPPANANGTDSFDYTLEDDNGATTSATVTITVQPVDDLPVAVDDTASVTEDDPATTIDVLANDIDIDGGPIAVGSVTQPAGGTVTITNGGSDLSYEPDADFCNDGSPTDDFSYMLTPGGSTATVAVTVVCVNDPPSADAGAATTDEDVSVTITLTGSDVEGDGLTFAIATGPSDGSLGAITPIDATSAEVTYTPDPDFNGSDSFAFVTNDGSEDSDAATVSITVAPVNDPPEAADDAFATNEDIQLTGNVFADNGNGTDVDPDDPLAVMNAGTLTATGLGGSVELQVNGDFTYIPPTNANGTDTFAYTLEDDNGATSTATVTITVAPVNDPPAFAGGGDVTGFEDTPFSQAWASAISPGPADEAGQTVTFLVNPTSDPGLFQSGPTIDENGQLAFTPAPDTTGTAEVDVIAMDDGGTDNGGDDTSGATTFTVEVAKAADLSLDKTSGSFFTPPGGALTYELIVTNPGPSDVVDARIEDPEPARLTFGNWQCAPAGLATCNTAAGSGPVDVLVTIPEGDSVTVTVDAQLTDSDTVPITNTASVSAPADVTELDTANNGDSDTDKLGMFVDSFEVVEPD